MVQPTIAGGESPREALHPLFLGRRRDLLRRRFARRLLLGRRGTTERADLVLDALLAAGVLALVELEVLVECRDRLVALVVLLVHEAEVEPALGVRGIEAGR